MVVRLLHSPADLLLYQKWFAGHPQATLWQSLDWKRYQEALGRETRLYTLVAGVHEPRLREMDQGDILASALVIIDRTSFGLSTWDIPRGPMGPLEAEHQKPNTDAPLLDQIIADAKKDRCMTIYCSPLHAFRSKEHVLLATGWRPSSRHEQPSATRIIDLSLKDEEILAQMHPKGRYNISVAKKHGVQVEESRDIIAFYRLLTETAGRDGFIAGPKKRYEMFLRELSGSFLLLAYASPPTRHSSFVIRHSNEPLMTNDLMTNDPLVIAGLMGVIHNSAAFYYYGASDYRHRALMAPYLLQWEAMQLARTRGARFYDLLGVAPPEAGPGEHPWEAMSTFKAKFGGQVVTYPPEQEITIRPGLKALLKAKRWILG